MSSGTSLTSYSPVAGIIEMQVCIKNDGSMTTGSCKKNQGITMFLFGRKA
jgi:hypothetical protein